LRRWDLPIYEGKPLAQVDLGRRAGKESLRVRMRGPVQHSFSRTVFHYLAGVHHRDISAHVGNDGDIV
jgi:hypothetical protein